MNGFTRIFLVLLRLAIGWHFLYEGFEKLHSLQVGPTSTSKPWTSAGYLKESVGPLSPYFRDLAGDTDEDFLARLTLSPVLKDQDPEGSARSRFPGVLNAEWDALAGQLMAATKADAAKLAEAKRALEQEKETTAQWLYKGTKRVKVAFSQVNAEIEKTTPQRLQELREKLKKLREAQENVNPRFEADVIKDKWITLKGDVRRLRAELSQDLEGQTHRMAVNVLKSLGVDLIKIQTDLGLDDAKAKQFRALVFQGFGLDVRPLGLEPVREPDGYALQDVAAAARKALGAESLPPPPQRPWGQLEWSDFAVRWGLVAIGVCLLLGLFTRSACVGGAVMLLMFYLAMPPWPGVPENPKAEGHYLFVNKNIIEMLALLALASTPSGRWLGFDGLLHWAWGRFRGKHKVKVQDAELVTP